MNIKSMWKVLGLVLLLILAGTAVYATTDGTTSYTINQNVIAGGGHQGNSGGSYSLAGTVGQTAVSPPTTSVSYTLASGFWHSDAEYTVFLPVIIK